MGEVEVEEKTANYKGGAPPLKKREGEGRDKRSRDKQMEREKEVNTQQTGDGGNPAVI